MIPFRAQRCSVRIYVGLEQGDKGMTSIKSYGEVELRLHKTQTLYMF